MSGVASTDVGAPVPRRALGAATTRPSARCFAPEATLRAIVPPGPREDDGRDAIVRRFRLWTEEIDEYEVLAADAAPCADVLRLRWELGGLDPNFEGDGRSIFEQTAYAELDDGRHRCDAPRLHRPPTGPVTPPGARPSIRLAELVAALSLGIDLGFGQPMEHVLRQCLIALRLAERVGLDDEDARGRLLHRAAGQRRLPHRRARAGQVVRRRHRAEGDQVRPRAREPARDGVRRLRRIGAGTRRCTASGSGSSSRSRATATSTA